MSIFPAIVLMWAVAWGFGRLARGMKIPSVVGELIGGIILGPTVLGFFWPQAQAMLFPVQGTAAGLRQGMAQVGLLTFLFFAGLEMELGHLKENTRAILLISLTGMVVPFVLSFGAAWSFHQRWESALFLGIALSISALPVIARIFLELNLHKTRLAAIVLSAASIDDLVGWCLFAGLLGGLFPEPTLVGILEKFSLFAAYFAGLACSSYSLKKGAATIFLSRLCRKYLVVLYFVAVGLQVDLLRDFNWFLIAAVLLLSCAGKILGVRLGAFWAGLPNREAWAVSFAMNARGAMEIALAATALHYHVISPPLFVALILMAVVTSLLSGPALQKLTSAQLQR